MSDILLKERCHGWKLAEQSLTETKRRVTLYLWKGMLAVTVARMWKSDGNRLKLISWYIREKVRLEPGNGHQDFYILLLLVRCMTSSSAYYLQKSIYDNISDAKWESHENECSVNPSVKVAMAAHYSIIELPSSYKTMQFKELNRWGPTTPGK